jgi:thiamine-monophosphate kinase
MADLAAETGTTLAGGDLTRSAVLFVAVTVVGHGDGPDAFVTRAGARPGDLLAVTGELGGATAGLMLLADGDRGGELDPEARAALLERQRRPRPRLDAGIALAAAGATAMIDISDGLGGDARHLAEASGARLRIDAARLPVAAGVAAVAEDPLRVAVSGGEDYELLAALPAAELDTERLAAAAGTAVTVVGEVVAGSGVEVRLPGGRTLEPAGFEQLR